MLAEERVGLGRVLKVGWCHAFDSFVGVSVQQLDTSKVGRQNHFSIYFSFFPFIKARQIVYFHTSSSPRGSRLLSLPSVYFFLITGPTVVHCHVLLVTFEHSQR